ncbi:putative coiled-coil domain-containing protein [Xylona heveae TC161]|uniref:Putative coiled-coil domain-containing protein n=1 Tax=Xylona heveae (strain CBS 132557 / TC161) TaxID=1328760 RepID=A0A165J083_XYLHT|nr:putative coiled-coil domain-containing protein [Xylona heveae TC161]KZF25611.1 putative coiled-coil domain-containing protein [Xylona heveae TC161]
MSSQSSLDAAANERKARLAQLKTLKRKQEDIQEDKTEPADLAVEGKPADVTTKFLSGRNYDAEMRAPKLGFEMGPNDNQITLEDQARDIAEETAKKAEEEEKADKPIDLFRLQPKKPNWDLKRDLDRKLEILNVRTDNAIARLVRERIQGVQPTANGQGEKNGNHGLEGTSLVEGVRVREREEEEDRRLMEEEDLA